MSVVWAVAWREIRALLRDPMALFNVFVFPFLIAILFGSVFGGGGGGGGIGQFDVAYVARDGERMEAAVRKALIDGGSLRLLAKTEDEARDAVRKGEVAAALIVPDDLDAHDPLTGAEPPKIELLLDPSRSVEAGILEGIVAQAWFTALQSQLEVPATAGFDPFGAGEPPIARTDLATEQGDERSSFDITFPQGIVWGMIGIVMTFATSLVQEREAGTLTRLRAAPIRLGHILAGKALAALIATIALCALMLAVGAGLLGVSVSSFGALLVGVIGVGVCFTGLMIAVSTIAKTERATNGLGWMLMMIFAMVGGSMLPLVFMPDWMQSLSVISPMRWALVGLEAGVWRDYSLVEALPNFGVLLLIGGVAFGLGMRRIQSWVGA